MKKFFKHAIITIIILMFIGHYLSDKKDEIMKDDVVADVEHTSADFTPTQTGATETQITKAQENFARFLIKDTIEIDYQDQGIIDVTADKFYKDYHANEVKADQLYKDKPVVISGTVANISRSIGDNYYLSLATKKTEEIGDLEGMENMKGIFYVVHAGFTKEYSSVLAELHKGQKVKLHCIGSDFLIGTPMLKQCCPFDNWVQEQSQLAYEEFLPTLKEWVRDKYSKNIKHLNVKTDSQEKHLLSPLPFDILALMVASTSANEVLPRNNKDMEKWLNTWTNVLQKVFNKSPDKNADAQPQVKEEFKELTIGELLDMIKTERAKQVQK